MSPLPFQGLERPGLRGQHLLRAFFFHPIAKGRKTRELKLERGKYLKVPSY